MRLKVIKYLQSSILPISKKIEYVVYALLFSYIWAFYTFFYDHHLQEQEQIYIFEWSWSFFMSYLKTPGGISGWIGDFFIQFCYIPHIGGTLILVACICIWLNIKLLLSRLSILNDFWIISVLPVLLVCITHYDFSYRFSGTIAYLLSITSFCLYTLIKHISVRRYLGIPIILLTYWVCGGPYIGTTLLIIAFECFLFKYNIIEYTSYKSTRYIYLLCSIYTICALLIPILIRRFFLTISWKMVWYGDYIYEYFKPYPSLVFIIWLIIPFILILSLYTRNILTHKKNIPATVLQAAIVIALSLWGYVKHADMHREHIYTMLHLTQEKKWDDVLKYSKKHDLESLKSACLVNFALAEKGVILDSMFYFPQYGRWGLTPTWKEDFWEESMANRVASQVVLANGSLGLARATGFISNVYGMRGKMPNILREQIKLEIINGAYPVADKMLDPLENTLFYREWAKGMRSLLKQTDKINNLQWVMEWERKRFYSTMFDDVKDFPQRRITELKTNPKNIIAFEYFAANALLTMDVKLLIENLYLLDIFEYTSVPVHIQELLVSIPSTSYYNTDISKFKVSNEVRQKFQEYTTTYSKIQKSPDFKKIMKEKFGNTYWYYMSFIEQDMKEYNNYDKEEIQQR